nr:MAG TPA_asm: hypothetical protein [Caudoviricetes sp.]
MVGRITLGSLFDGTRYKQTGNSLAIPCALRVIGYIADYIREGAEK